MQMMEIVWNRHMAKALEKYRNAGRTKRSVVIALSKVIELLTIYDHRSQEILRTDFRDHALKGEKHDQRELHLSQDDLLIYRVHKPSIIELLRIITHEELRKRK